MMNPKGKSIGRQITLSITVASLCSTVLSISVKVELLSTFQMPPPTRLSPSLPNVRLSLNSTRVASTVA